DDRVYERAAGTDEWAVSGAFAFAQATRETLTGKMRQAFAHGLLGLESFGRSTFARVATAQPADLAAIEQALARHLVAAYGAPSLERALPAAREELDFALDLCRGADVGAVFTVRRSLDRDGAIKEEFRIVRRVEGAPLHASIWTVVDDEG